MKNYINLKKLPTKKHAGKITIDWINSIGITMEFNYNNIQGSLKIISHDSKYNILKVEYKNHHFDIHTKRLHTCSLGFLDYIKFSSPEILKFLINESDALLYKKYSSSIISVKCENCNSVFSRNIKYITNNGICCKKCGDGLSYPEKFMRELLIQLNINFEQQYKATIDGKNRFFDFKLNNLLVEMDGGFHYIDNISISKYSLEEIKDIDNKKDLWARKNGFDIIRINSKISDFEYIKTNILNSNLAQRFDLSLIDWTNIEVKSQKNIMIEVCKYKKMNPSAFCGEIGKIFKLHERTISLYLKRGNDLGLCLYVPDEEIKRMNTSRSRPIYVFKEGKLLEEFQSTEDCSRNSEKIFGLKFNQTNIRNVLKGIASQHKGYTFKYKY